MTQTTRTNRHQRDFLRRLRLHPAGLPPREWPNPVVLRRWMRHEGFVKSLDSIRAALQVQGDLQLMSAGAMASEVVSEILAATHRSADSTAAIAGSAEMANAGDTSDRFARDADVAKKQEGRLRSLVHLLRVVHWRQKEPREIDDAHRAADARAKLGDDPNEHPLHGLIHLSRWGDPEYMARAWRLIADQQRESTAEQ